MGRPLRLPAPRAPRPSARRRFAVAAGAVAFSALLLGSARAAGEGSDAGEAPVDATPVPADGAAARLRAEAAAVRALLAGELPAAVAPATLFDVDLTDAPAVALEAARLAVLVPAPGARPRPGAGARDADAEAGVDPALWDARLDLDAARLAFLSLPEDERARLLAAHEQRRRAALPPDAARAEALETEQREALEAAERARTEAERLVAREEARLLGVLSDQDAFQADLATGEDALLTEKEATVGWVQRAREASADPSSAVADRTYDALRGALRDARDALDATLADARNASTAAPVPGPDPLADVGVDVDRGKVDGLRREAQERHAALAAREAKLRDARRVALYDAINSLNSERLALLAALSDDKRDAITGFGAAGRDQAAAEARQLTLIARSHHRAAFAWIARWRAGDRALVDTAGRSLAVLAGWLVALVAFSAWRRQSGPLFADILAQVVDRDRRARRLSPSVAQRALATFVRVRGPFEWLLLLVALGYLVPAAVRNLLEVRILWIVATWTIGGALAVSALDALASGPALVALGAGPRASRSAELRLRSLRLVGRVTVAFALVLEVTALLVGRGTIHDWVASTCWFASVPVFLVLVRWWRPHVFSRIAGSAKRSALARWVLANRTGWKSFAAASLGAVYVFVVGTWRVGRARVGRLTLTRRALAYLFQRRLDKRSNAGDARPRGALPPATFAALGPDVATETRVACPSEEALDELAARLRDRRGGIVAIVGERGAGKTSAARRLRELVPGTLVAGVTSSDRGALAPVLAREAAVASADDLEAVVAAIDEDETQVAVVLDDAHAFAPPIMGALAELDVLLRLLGRHARRTTWILCIDHVVWPFLERARGARPLFDEVVRLDAWHEESVAELLRARAAQAGVAPRFDHLVDPLPPSADDEERAAALSDAETSFYRLLWDQTGGNPGAALHAFRRALAMDEDDVVQVVPPEPLDIADLEALPDASIFVLRSVLQLAPATRPRLAEATLLSAAAVDDALRYALGRGYVERKPDGAYRVTWTWFRALTRFLQRRHLLSSR